MGCCCRLIGMCSRQGSGWWTWQINSMLAQPYSELPLVSHHIWFFCITIIIFKSLCNRRPASWLSVQEANSA
jgi:hypothetical protein